MLKVGFRRHRTVSTPAAARILTRIRFWLRLIAIGVPLALLAMVAADGLSWTDLGVVAFAAVILWLFVGIVSFTVGALQGAERSHDAP